MDRDSEILLLLLSLTQCLACSRLYEGYTQAELLRVLWGSS